MRAWLTDEDRACPVERSLAIIGGRWKGVILFYLAEEGAALRFNELRRRLNGVTHRMLTLQLRELEEDGLIERTVYPEVPPRVEYRLTAAGEGLAPILCGLRDWGLAYWQSRQAGGLPPLAADQDGSNTPAAPPTIRA